MKSEYKKIEKNWNWFFTYLSFLRWYKFYQYLFLFIFFSISIIYFVNRQITYIPTEWMLYNSAVASSNNFTLDSAKYYKISWENPDNFVQYLTIDGRDNYFLNFYYREPAAWRKHDGNFWEYPLGNTLYFKATKPTTISIKLANMSKSLFTAWFKIYSMTVTEEKYIDNKQLLDIEAFQGNNGTYLK